MIYNDDYYEKFLKENSESRFSKDDPLIKIVLPESFKPAFLKGITLQDRVDIRYNLITNINVVDEYQADAITYSIQLNKSKNSLGGTVLDGIKIVVSSVESPEEACVYVKTSCSNEYRRKYFFVSRTNDGILMFQIKLELKMDLSVGIYIVNSVITETFYNATTSNAIGDAYQNPELLSESERYGIVCDDTTTYTNINSLTSIYELFNKRCGEVLNNSSNKTMSKDNRG